MSGWRVVGRVEYTFENINGGVAIYHGPITNAAHAVRIVMTEEDARRWIADRDTMTRQAR